MPSSTTTISNETFQTQMLEKVSRSFALTIPQLPAALTQPVANAYLMCRIADTIEDDAGLSMGQKKEFFSAFIHVLAGKASAEQFAETLYPLLSDTTLPAEHELIRHAPVAVRIFFGLNERQQTEIQRCVKTMSFGMLQFQQIQNPVGLEAVTQLNDYCYYVAGVVGEMLTGLFCDYSQEIDQRGAQMSSLAASFGQGLQMTNIIKDVWEDKARGACWFPKDIFREAGFDLADLCPGNEDAGFHQGLASLIGVAHAHLQYALSYTLLIPNHETGIRKFCYWAIGMALGTLQRIHDNRDYTCARDVTIPRATTRRILMASNASIRSNLLLKLLFRSTARGLPVSDMKAVASAPAGVQGFGDLLEDAQRA